MRAIFFIFLCITLRPKCCRAQHRQWIWNPSFDVIACEKFHVGKQANGKWTWWTLRAGNEIVVPREWRMECAGYIFFFCSYVFFHLMCVRDPSRRGLVCAVVGCSQRVEATWASDSWLPFSIEEWTSCRRLPLFNQLLKTTFVGQSAAYIVAIVLVSAVCYVLDFKMASSSS